MQKKRTKLTAFFNGFKLNIVESYCWRKLNWLKFEWVNMFAYISKANGYKIIIIYPSNPDSVRVVFMFLYSIVRLQICHMSEKS